MLNLPGLRCLEQAEGLVLPSLFSDITGISARTLRKSSDLSYGTLKKAQRHARDYTRQQFLRKGWSAEEIDVWLAQHPGNDTAGMLYSDLVYGSQVDGFITCPHTLELAVAIDKLSMRLLEARQQNDMEGFKEALLNNPLVGPEHFTGLNNKRSKPTAVTLQESLRMARDWPDVDSPLREVAANMLLSLLACWDVEFCSKQFKSRTPRSCFAMLLPRLNYGEEQTGKGKRRYVHPVRRLIDFAACFGEFVRKDKWPNRIPQIRHILPVADVAEQDLKKWRNGAKRFKRSDFQNLWQQLCPDRKEINGIRRAYEPWPLFVAAMFWQGLLVKNPKISREKASTQVMDEYLPWWERQYKELRAKGTVFGASPWPACFNEI